MAELRKQTVTFKFGEGKAVSNLELWELLKEEWDVKLEELMMVQLETSGKKVHVKFVKQERAEQVAAKERVTLKRRDGSECEVTLQGPGQGVKVLRVRNLPIEVSTEAVMLCLGQYGQVFEVREERYPRGSCYQGLLTGTRLVRMAMKRAVPSYVRISGVEAMVFYHGQKPTCQICGETDHLRANCPNRRRPPSWADRAQGRKGEDDDVTHNDDLAGSPPPAAGEMARHGSAPNLRNDVTPIWDEETIPHAPEQEEPQQPGDATAQFLDKMLTSGVVPVQPGDATSTEPPRGVSPVQLEPTPSASNAESAELLPRGVSPAKEVRYEDAEWEAVINMECSQFTEPNPPRHG